MKTVVKIWTTMVRTTTLKAGEDMDHKGEDDHYEGSDEDMDEGEDAHYEDSGDDTELRRCRPR